MLRWPANSGGRYGGSTVYHDCKNYHDYHVTLTFSRKKSKQFSVID